MADRKEYHAMYYLKNKKKMNQMAMKYHEEMKARLGDKLYKEWKRKENAKYRMRLRETDAQKQTTNTQQNKKSPQRALRTNSL